MEEIRFIVDRFPHRELDIRRCFARDASFRAICSDYEEARRARDHWLQAVRQGDHVGQHILEDYENMLAELEEEILSYLNCP